MFFFFFFNSKIMGDGGRDSGAGEEPEGLFYQSQGMGASPVSSRLKFILSQ